MELKNLETFVQTAELSSFTKAAERLGYTQSTVSLQIRQLEDELGIRLFERVNHTVKLTAKGSDILSLAHQLLATSSNIRKAAGENRNLQGCIRIAMAESLCHWLFHNGFDEFHIDYPDISLKVISASTEEMFRLLNQNEADLVYTLDKHIYNRNYVIAYEEPMQAHFVTAPGNKICTQIDNSDSISTDLTIEEVISQPMILTEKGMSYRRMLEEFLASRSLEIHPYLEIGDPSLICELLQKGSGISYLPDYVTEDLVQAGKLVRLELPQIKLDIWKQLLYHRDKWVSPEMQTVIDYLK